MQGREGRAINDKGRKVGLFGRETGTTRKESSHRKEMIVKSGKALSLHKGILLVC